MTTLIPEIFKRDSAGKIRVWAAEVDGANARWRTMAGIHGGTIVTSDWTTTTGKQGRNDSEQAHTEAHAERTKKLAREYRDSINDLGKDDQPFKPMLAHKFEGWTGPVFSQPKLDGIRCIVTAKGMFSREGKPIVSCPHVVGILEHIFRKHPDLVLDGELYNHELHDDFNSIVSAVKRTKPTEEDLTLSARMVQYHVYDMPSLEKPFGHRFIALGDLFGEKLGPIHRVQTDYCVNEEKLNLAYERYLAAGYEGQMVRANERYENKRSKTLLKRKEFQDHEYPVVAIEEGNGNWSGYAKRAVLQLPDGREFGAGISGTQAEMKALLHGSLPQTATVRFFALTPDGIPRFPVAKVFHHGERL